MISGTASVNYKRVFEESEEKQVAKLLIQNAMHASWGNVSSTAKMILNVKLSDWNVTCESS